MRTSVPEGMRVLVLFGNGGMNGLERANIQVFATLKKHGVQALFLTHARWGHYNVQPALDDRGLPWTKLDYSRRFSRNMPFAQWVANMLRTMTGSLAFLRHVRRFKPTHIYCANVVYFISVLPGIWCTRKKVVFRLGDAPIIHHVMYRWLWRYAVSSRVHRFICVSESVRERLIELGIPQNKTEVIYSFPPERKQAAIPFRAPWTQGKVVLYIGQLIANKGLHVFVDAAMEICRRRRDVVFAIAGGLYSQNAYALQVLRKIREGMLEHRIYFLGHVDDVEGLFRHADLHVCPSVYEEAAPNVVMEAKRAGVPSVVFPRGGLPELVRDSEEGFVCTHDNVTALRERIEGYLDLDDCQKSIMGEAARASLGRLGATSDVFAQRWLQVFNSSFDGRIAT